MSLQLLAKQMEAKGRKGDSMLVHMTPGEVAGLQSLAEAAGGTLTVNPETGLVEANFLKKMLPTLVGIGLGASGVGALGAAALVGGGTALATGDMKQGLMAGLGAYGGAGLGAGLNAAGTTAAQSGAMGAEAAAQGATENAAVTMAPPATPAPAPVSNVVPENPVDAVGRFGVKPVSQPITTPTPNMTEVPTRNLAAEYGLTPAPAPGSEAGVEAINARAASADAAFQDQNFAAKSGQGLRSLSEAGSRDAFMKSVGGGSGLAKNIGYSAVSAAGLGDAKEAEEAPVDDELYVYDFDYGRTGADRSGSSSSSESEYFRPEFSNKRKVKASEYAEGGIAAAPAGIASSMSDASSNAMSYLMGQAPTSFGGPASSMPTASNASQAGLQYLMGQAPTSAFVTPAPAQPAQPVAAPSSDQMYTFDPQSGQFAKNLSYVDPEVVAANAKAAEDAEAEKQEKLERGRRSTTRRARARRSAEGGVIYAEGGLMGLAKGGMASGGFVIPADVVSMVGEGNTDAGYKRIKSMVPSATAIKGKDGGQADTVKTSIDGKQPARVAHGEMYVPPETVKRMGGAKKLYAMMDRVRQQATGSKKQIKPVSLKKAMA